MNTHPHVTQEHGVDGEVSALGVLLPVRRELHLRVSSVRDHVNPQGGDLKIFVMQLELQGFQK